MRPGAGRVRAPARRPGVLVDHRMSALRSAAILACSVLLSACVMSTPEPEATEPPPMRWDFHPQAPSWTTATLGALQSHGALLAMQVPDDIETWCPGYAENSLEERRAFWAGLFSTLAKYESTWNPEVAGGGGRWIGLLQIAPRTAQHYGCAADTAAELKDGGRNLSCGVRIAAAQVARDNLVAGDGRQGVGRDWAPFRDPSKRAEMAAWTRAQDYCQ